MKAQKAVINFGDIELEVYQLPNGDYTLGQTQVGKSIGKGHTSVIQFLSTTSPFASPYKDFLEERSSEIIVQDEAFSFDLKVKPIPIKITMAYWTYWAIKGNTKAQALLAAGTEETLTRLADKAFGVAKTEAQYQAQTNQSVKEFEIVLNVMQRLEQKIDSMENELKLLRPAYEKLEKIESTLEDYPNLKEALEYLVANANKARTTYPLSKWLKDNHLDFIPNNVRMSIGRLVTSWCKLVEFKAPKGQYSDAFDPVLRFAVNYKLTQENK
jgi:hypothetical protein